MTEQVRAAVDLTAAPERVWDILMDPRRLEDWVTTHAGLPGDPPKVLHEGSSFEQDLRVAGTTFTVTWTVTGCDPNRWVSWEGRGPAGSKAGVRYRLEPAGDGGTRFTYVNEFELPGGSLGRIAGRTVGSRVGRREAERSLQSLKRLLARESSALS